MIANFNGIFYLVVFLLVMSINAFYAYNTLFNTKNFISKYGVDMTAAFFARFVGAFISAVVLMQLYILFRGTVATWAFFNFMFVAMTLISAVLTTSSAGMSDPSDFKLSISLFKISTSSLEYSFSNFQYKNLSLFIICL